MAGWAADCTTVLLRDYAGAPTDRRSSGLRAHAMSIAPSAAILDFERFVEAGNAASAESLANLMADIQIFSARVNAAGYFPGSPSTWRQTGHDIESNLLAIGAISAHIAALFDYGRRQSEEAPAWPSWSQVRTALRLAGADEDLQPDLFGLLEARERNGRQPGLLHPDPEEPQPAALPRMGWRRWLSRWPNRLKKRIPGDTSLG